MIAKSIRVYLIENLIRITDRGEYTCYTGKAISIWNEAIRKGFEDAALVRVPNGTFWQGTFRDKFVEINDITKEKYLELSNKNIDGVINEAILMETIQKKAEQMAIPSDTKPKESELMKAGEAAAILGVTHNAIRRWIRKGTLWGTQIENYYYVRRDSVEKLTQTTQKGGTPPLFGDNGGQSNPILYEKENSAEPAEQEGEDINDKIH